MNINTSKLFMTGIFSPSRFRFVVVLPLWRRWEGKKKSQNRINTSRAKNISTLNEPHRLLSSESSANYDEKSSPLAVFIFARFPLPTAISFCCVSSASVFATRFILPRDFHPHPPRSQEPIQSIRRIEGRNRRRHRQRNEKSLSMRRKIFQ